MDRVPPWSYRHGALGVLALAAAAAIALGPSEPVDRRPADEVVQIAPAASGITPATPAGPLPAGLEGTSAPDGLIVDSRGHLVPGPRVREVFDYFLAAGNERTLEQIDAMVDAHIVSRLKPPAVDEARDLWRRYAQYLSLAQAQMLKASGGHGPGSGGLRGMLDTRAALRRRMLPDVAESWFASEELAERQQLEQLDIANNRSVDAAQRAAAIEAIRLRDPVYREAVREGGDIAATGALVDRMRAQGASAAAIAAAVSARSGDAAAAARVQSWVERDMAWDARYAAYQTARRQLLASRPGGSGVGEAELSELRGRYFSNPAERLRAQGRDRSVP